MHGPCSTSRMMKPRNAADVPPLCPRKPKTNCANLTGEAWPPILIRSLTTLAWENHHGVMHGGVGPAPHIHPLRGLRAMVPSPRGIRAVGEFAVGDRDGELRPVDEKIEGEPGETGFILRPLIPGCGGMGACDVGAGNRGIEDRGVGGRIFSR